MKKNKFKIKIMFLLFFTVLLFTNKNSCFADEQLNVDRGPNDGENAWFYNYKHTEVVSDFVGEIGGNRALCIDIDRVAASGRVTYAGSIANRIGVDRALNAASIMYYSSTPDRIARWINYGGKTDISDWLASNPGSRDAYFRIVSQLAFWQEVENQSGYENLLVNAEYWRTEFVNTRKEMVKEGVIRLLTVARNLKDDFITENNMSITVDSSSATPKTISGGRSLVGPYRVNATNLNGQITLSKKSGATGITADSNGNPISSITSGGEVYVRFDAGDTITAEFNVTGRTKSQIVCQWWRNSNSSRQDFAILDLHEVNATTSFPSTPEPIPSQTREVYVRHVDKDGNILSQTTSTRLLLKNGSTSNTEVLPLSTSNPRNFKERYTYSSKDRMRVVYAGEITGYNYLGNRHSVAPDYTTAYNNLRNGNQSLNSSIGEVTTRTIPDNTKDVTVIEFVYEGKPVVITPSVTPTVHTYYSHSPSSSQPTTYIPSGENIQAYILTPKFLDMTVSYSLGSRLVQVAPATYDEEGNMTSPAKFEPVYWYDLTSYSGYKLNVAEYGNTSNSYGNKIIGTNNEDLLYGTTSAFNLNVTGVDATLNSVISRYRTTGESFSLATVTSIKDSFKRSAEAELKAAKTVQTDFPRTFEVPISRYNGLRTAEGRVTYVGVGGASGTVQGVSNNANYVNVYTPVRLGSVSVSSGDIVDHTVSNQSANIIQKNAEFTLSIQKPNFAPIYSGLDSTKYVDHYYAIFDMDILLLSANKVREGNNDVMRPSGYTVRKNTPVRIERNGTSTTTFRAKATSSQNTEGAQGDIVNQLQNKITVIATTYNMPENPLESNVLNLNNNTYITSTGNNWQSPSTSSRSHSTFGTSLTYKNMLQDAFYFAKTQIVTNNIGRIYDFKITDCTDVNFKDVFRRTSTTTSVNDLTGNVYYSGIKALKIYTNEVNVLENRKDSEIYANNKTITKAIPIGPYKHVSGSYLQAPKMGYRISFDLKTSGYYDGSATKRVEITPSYYYISKDSTTFLDSSEITLYYKDSSGKYKTFENSGYNIAFKPNDGYRSVYNQGTTPNLNSMSQKLENLDISRKFTLGNNMMSYSDNSFIQAWYGEFKLPNSTIAVKKSGGSINNPLKDGYIGVRFDMVCITRDSSGKEIRISYNQEDKKSGAVNTTQWDYEGYLGISSGQEINSSNTVTIKLEKANWTINNQGRYKRVISTVAFFDLDNRAANDFD
jgi:hypothetical protein